MLSILHIEPESKMEKLKQMKLEIMQQKKNLNFQHVNWGATILINYYNLSFINIIVKNKGRGGG